MNKKTEFVRFVRISSIISLLISFYLSLNFVHKIEYQIILVFISSIYLIIGIYAPKIYNRVSKIDLPNAKKYLDP